jgi:hypothetical protein
MKAIKNTEMRENHAAIPKDSSYSFAIDCAVEAFMS